MFRRKEEFENSEGSNDLLSQVDDDVIDTDAKPSYPGASASSASESSSANSSSNEAQPFSPASSSVSSSPIPKPAAASAFRPAAATIAANRVPVPAEPRSNAGASAAPSNKSSKRVLTVGHDIHMKGEISTCDRLVIEGSVDATLKDVHTVELAQTGSFKGTAEIEDAEISGVFEGDLIVRGRLIIYATGKVSGSISYGEIEIERGGQISGTIQTAGERSESKAQKKVA